jgi:type IX secretion system PorP/SprF family membrane protein
MKTLRIFVILSLFASWVACHSQDAHFSHIHASPLNNNPAWTGVFNDNLRLIANYRNQWKSPTSNFNTFNVSFDGRYVIPGTMMSINGGVNFMTDKGGDLGFGKNNYNFLGGLTFPIGGGGRNFISVGTQIGFIDHHIDVTKIVAIDDEPLINSLELKKKSLDLSAGLGYFFSFNETDHIYAGVALYHINRPDVSILDYNQDGLYWRWVGNMGATYEFRRIGIQPSVIMYWQGPHREITPGSYFYFNLKKRNYGDTRNMKIYAGVWARYYIHSEYNSGFDAVILSTRYDMDKLVVGFSFDLTLSQLVEASSLIGSPELSLIYTIPVESRRRQYNSTKRNSKHKMQCPAF